MLKIGNVAIEQTAALAPMASVADRAYRSMCKDYGACYLVSEMVSAKGICFTEYKATDLLTIKQSEHPMAIQLFGSEPDYFVKALPIVLKYKPDIIDINMGCPVPKVTSNGGGCSLMRNPGLAAEIVTVTVRNSPIPITVKIRKGWDDNSINAVEFSKKMQDCGASAIIIHGRTKTQMYSGCADWDIIAKVKKSVDIPVIASGDVTSPETAKALYQKTGADLIMIGRGSYGKPWLFQQISDYLKTSKYSPDPNIECRMNIMLEHIRRICEDKGEYIGMKEARSQAMRYLYGICGAAGYRSKCSKFEKYSDALKLVNEILGDF